MSTVKVNKKYCIAAHYLWRRLTTSIIIIIASAVIPARTSRNSHIGIMPKAILSSSVKFSAEAAKLNKKAEKSAPKAPNILFNKFILREFLSAYTHINTFYRKHAPFAIVNLTIFFPQFYAK